MDFELLPVTVRHLDVALLGLLGSTAQQEDDKGAQEPELHPVARAVIDSGLVDTTSGTAAVSEVAQSDSIDAGEDPRLRSLVTERGNPLLEGCPVFRSRIDPDFPFIGLTHDPIVAQKRHGVKLDRRTTS